MATQRVTSKVPQKQNGQANGSEKISAIQSRQAKKQKVEEEQRLHGRIRLIAVVLILVVATLVLYYLYTTTQLETPSSKNAARKAATSATKQQQVKEKKTQTKEKVATKPKKKKKTESSDKKSKSAEENNKVRNRVLRQPIPPSDVDRPHVLDIITGDNLIVAKKYEEALERFNAILKQFPQSPRAQFGKGITLSYLAEEKQSNKLMDSAINFFRMAGESIVASDMIKLAALAAMSDRAQSRGDLTLAIEGMEKLVELRNDTVLYANQLGVLYLSAGKKKKAKNQFKKCVKKFEDNHFARAQLGAILFSEKKYEKALPLLMEGIRGDRDIRTDGRFYNFAGESLMKLNRSEEALVIYGEAVSMGVFPSLWQRPLVSEAGLRALPWWSPDKTGYLTDLDRIEKKLDTIAGEALALFDKEKLAFVGEGRSSPHFVLYSKGKKDLKNCGLAPRTCALIETFPEASSCRHGSIKFSVLPARTHIPAHVGRTNTKLQVLVGLDVRSREGIRIRVAEEIKILGDRQIGILDESFEKEVWYEGEEPAIYMTIDVWHPDLSHEAQLKL